MVFVVFRCCSSSSEREDNLLGTFMYVCLSVAFSQELGNLHGSVSLLEQIIATIGTEVNVLTNCCAIMGTNVIVGTRCCNDGNQGIVGIPCYNGNRGHC
jgi:hypothetical protein